MADTDDLEQRVRELEKGINRLELQQEQTREVLKSRFDALNKGQDLLVTKVDAFRELVGQLAGDASASPAGRALHADVQRLTVRTDAHGQQLDAIMEFENEVRGALGLLKWIGASSILLALLSLLRGFGIWH